jgi:hypothetical protein
MFFPCLVIVLLFNLAQHTASHHVDQAPAAPAQVQVQVDNE